MATAQIASSFFGQSHTSAIDTPNYTPSSSHTADINNNSNTSANINNCTDNAPSEDFLESTRKLEAKYRKRAFISLCKRNRRLLQFSKVFDGHTLALAFIYLQRLAIKPYDYNDDHLYCALYLATATEEDSEEGVHELLVHRVGVSVEFPELDYTNVKRRCWTTHEEWRKELHKFHSKVTQMWKDLDFRTFIHAEEVAATQASLARRSSLFSPRQPRDLAQFAQFW